MIEDDAAPPKSLSQKIGAALPIALTALATVFAGLSNGELQQAMFWRSYAAQDQAKATNQWTYAGFKRDRSLMCQTTAATLRATMKVPAPTTMPAGTDEKVWQWLMGQGPEKADLPEITDERLKKLLEEIQHRAREEDLIAHAGHVNVATINAAIDDAEKGNERIDAEWSPTIKAATSLAEKTAGLAAAGYELERRRYLAEARYNQSIGFLYEARVKVSSANSEKHQRKSRNFFFAMLAAQIGAIVASLALARQRKSVLWAVAAGTGLVALLIGASVYLAEL